MQYANGTHKVKKSSTGQQVGWLHCFEVSGTYYDWFARIDGKTMPVPLSLSTYEFAYSSSDNTWWTGDSGHTNWTVTQWESNFTSFLDGKHGTNGWHKEARFAATSGTW